MSTDGRTDRSFLPSYRPLYTHTNSAKNTYTFTARADQLSSSTLMQQNETLKSH